MNGQAMAVVGLVLVAAIWGIGCMDDQRESIQEQNLAAETRVGRVPIFDLRLDDCFVDELLFREAEVGTVGESLEIRLVPCSDPTADLRVSRLFTVDADG